MNTYVLEDNAGGMHIVHGKTRHDTTPLIEQKTGVADLLQAHHLDTDDRLIRLNAIPAVWKIDKYDDGESWMDDVSDYGRPGRHRCSPGCNMTRCTDFVKVVAEYDGVVVKLYPAVMGCSAREYFGVSPWVYSDLLRAAKTRGA